MCFFSKPDLPPPARIPSRENPSVDAARDTRRRRAASGLNFGSAIFSSASAGPTIARKQLTGE